MGRCRKMGLLMCAVAAIALAGCGGDDEPADGGGGQSQAATGDLPTGPVEIRIDWWGEDEAPGAQEWLQSAMDAYSAEHTNVTFKSNLVATKALIPQQEATCEAKDGPTIQYFWGGIYTLGPGWKGCIAPIEDYVGSEEVEHYVARQEVTDEGKVLAAGWYAVPVFPVFYNKDVFTKAGVDPEEAFSSFDSMLEACRTFADKGTPMIGIGAKDESGIGYVWDNLASDTLSVQDMTTAVTGESSFADEKFVSIYEQQLEMRDAGCFPDDLLSTELYPGQQRVLSGKAAATVVTGSGVASFLKELGEEKSGVAILPSRGEGPYAGKMGATAQTLGITSFASDDQKKVAGDFIKFLHSEEQLNAFYDATGVPPADDRFDIEKVTSPVMKQVYQWMYEDGRPTISNFLPNPPVNQNAEMIKVLSGQTDTPQAAAESLEQVAEQWRKANQLLLKRYEGLAAQAKEDGS